MDGSSFNGEEVPIYVKQSVWGGGENKGACGRFRPNHKGEGDKILSAFSALSVFAQNGVEKNVHLA